MVATPVYYVNNFPIITSDAGAIEDRLSGEGANVLVSSLSEYLKVGRESTTLNFLTKSTASEFVGQTVHIVFDPDTAQYKVDGKAVVNVVGGAATDAVVAGVLAALGVGTSVVGVTAVVVGLASFWLWDALSEATGKDEAIASFIDNVIQSVRGPVPIDIQIVDTNGNVLAGALYEEDIDETTEYEAITSLIQQSQISSVIPQLAVGTNRIRVVEKTSISPQVREYKLYNGVLVDEISQTFDISKFDLLFLGTKNEPNTNGQIYAPLLFGENPFLFGSTNNQFFVPLPDTNGNIQPVGLYLGDIILGTDSEDRLDAFQAFGDRVGLDRFYQKQKVLLLGLDGDDIIDGNVDDDFIVGGEGNDTINGGFGTDIAIFSDDFENYEPTLLADGSMIFSHVRGTQSDDVDTLKDVEFAKFRDRIVSLPLDISITNPKSEPINKGVNITQIGGDNIITGSAIISGSYIYWEDETNRVLSLNTNTQQIREITIPGLDSEFLYDRVYEFSLGDGSGLVEEDKIAVQLNSSDGQFIDLALYDGNSLLAIDAVQDIAVFENQAVWQQNDLVFAYEYDSQATTVLADNRFGNTSGLPRFPNSDASEFSISEESVAWIGDLFAESGFTTEIYFYNGEQTIQLTSYTHDYYADPFADNFSNVNNVYTNGNSVVWTANRVRNGSRTDESVIFLYDGSETVQIGSFSNKLLFGVFEDEGLVNPPQISGNNVVWSTITQATDTGNPNDYTHTLYLYDGSETKVIHQVTRTHRYSLDSERGIRNLQIDGNNIAWTDLLQASPADPEYFIKRLLYSYNIADEDPQARIIHEGEYKLVHFEASENLTAWIAPESITVQLSDGEERTYFDYNLYAYDGQHIHKLSDLGSGPRSPGVRRSQLEVLSDRVIWIGEAQGIVADPYISGDDEVFVATFSNVVATTPTPTPIPTPIRQLIGTSGRDRLTGDTGDNELLGLRGNDILNGGAGRDRLLGGIGKDTLTGGADADQFVFDIGRRFKRSLIGIDVITDFQRPDEIILDRATFTALRGNRVSFQSVKTVAQAKSSRSLIAYARSTGALFYNQNGKAQGFGQGGQFADFKDGLNLAASDFIIQA